jgi:multiple antibiotic resistance protein
VSKPLLDYGLLAFVSLFTMVNPVGVLPVYVTMTSQLDARASRGVALRAVATAAGVLVLFALTGQIIFHFFAISVDSLRVVGGVIFFVMGYEMLQARLSRTKHDEETVAEYVEDVAITPLGIPIIAGPGAITTVILLMNEADTLARRAVLLSVLAAILAVTFALLVAARRVTSFLGVAGNKVLLRIMGLIVMVIAVEYLVAGLRPIVASMIPAAR